MGAAASRRPVRRWLPECTGGNRNERAVPARPCSVGAVERGSDRARARFQGGPLSPGATIEPWRPDVGLGRQVGEQGLEVVRVDRLLRDELGRQAVSSLPVLVRAS